MASQVRTCIGCRRASTAEGLVRLCVEADRIALAPLKGRSGRGASVHPRRDCLEAALKPGVLGRAFKRPVGGPLDPTEFTQRITATSLSGRLRTP